VTGFALLLLATQALAQTPQAAPSGDDYGPSMGMVLVRTVVVLGIVVALIYLSLNYGLRKMMGARALGVGGGRVVNVIERAALDQKHALYVVKVSDEYLLLGGGEGSLNLVAKLDKETVEKLKAEKAGGQAISPFLQKLLTRKGGGTPPKA
jgi:flagellar biogenesis protein FliO